MYINLMDVMGSIVNKEQCITEMKNRVKELKSLSPQKAAYTINGRYDKSHFRYFTSNYIEVAEDNQLKRWMWVDTRFKNKSGENIMFQFGKTAFGWQGALVGTEKEIVEHQSQKDFSTYTLKSFDEQELEKKYVSNVDIAEEAVENKEENCEIDGCEETNHVNTSLPSDFFVSLYDRLLIQKDWSLETRNLQNYIIILIKRINFCIEKSVDIDYCTIYNNEKTGVLLNSGLLDKFGKSILFVAGVNKDGVVSNTDLNLVDSKLTLSRMGFDKESLKGSIERVRFYNKDNSELIFSADIEDFDLENWARLTHCILERRDRFPESFSSYSPEALCRDMINAIELGIKLSKFDSNYIKPIYSPKFDSITFVIPYHVGNNFQKSPELGIIVTDFDTDFWQVMTIIDYDSAYIDSKTLSLYSNESF